MRTAKSEMTQGEERARHDSVDRVSLHSTRMAERVHMASLLASISYGNSVRAFDAELKKQIVCTRRERELAQHVASSPSTNSSQSRL